MLLQLLRRRVHHHAAVLRRRHRKRSIRRSNSSSSSSSSSVRLLSRRYSSAAPSGAQQQQQKQRRTIPPKQQQQQQQQQQQAHKETGKGDGSGGGIKPTTTLPERAHPLRIAKGDERRFPLRRFEGTIDCTHDPVNAEHYLRKLLQVQLLGLDTESDPRHQKGASLSSSARGPDHISTLQLSSSNYAVVLQLDRWKPSDVPRTLRRIMSSPKVFKAAQDPFNEVAQLRKQLGIETRALVDVQYAAKQLAAWPTNLRALSCVFLNHSMCKRQQMSGWSARVLTRAQATYAATDAWVARRILQRILWHRAQSDAAFAQLSLSAQLRRTRLIVGDFDDDEPVACSNYDTCAVPRTLHAFMRKFSPHHKVLGAQAAPSRPLFATQTPRVMLKRALSHDVEPELMPVYSQVEQRPEGFLAQVQLPHLVVVANGEQTTTTKKPFVVTHSRPFVLLAHAYEFVALKAFHLIHTPEQARVAAASVKKRSQQPHGRNYKQQLAQWMQLKKQASSASSSLATATLAELIRYEDVPVVAAVQEEQTPKKKKYVVVVPQEHPDFKRPTFDAQLTLFASVPGTSLLLKTWKCNPCVCVSLSLSLAQKACLCILFCVVCVCVRLLLVDVNTMVFRNPVPLQDKERAMLVCARIALEQLGVLSVADRGLQSATTVRSSSDKSV
jgi:hypothetical protein